MRNLPRQRWVEAEPARFERERREMAELAPEMRWVELNGAGGWEGHAPIWPFDRDPPPGLDDFLDGARLKLLVAYWQAYPAVQPAVFPLEPLPPLERRLLHKWHLNGDGSICLLQSADAWTGRETAAELVVKASGWLVEYLLVERELRETMSEEGIVTDPSFDSLISA